MLINKHIEINTITKISLQQLVHVLLLEEMNLIVYKHRQTIVTLIFINNN